MKKTRELGRKMLGKNVVVKSDNHRGTTGVIKKVEMNSDGQKIYWVDLDNTNPHWESFTRDQLKVKKIEGKEEERFDKLKASMFIAENTSYNLDYLAHLNVDVIRGILDEFDQWEEFAVWKSQLDGYERRLSLEREAEVEAQLEIKPAVLEKIESAAFGEDSLQLVMKHLSHKAELVEYVAEGIFDVSYLGSRRQLRKEIQTVYRMAGVHIKAKGKMDLQYENDGATVVISVIPSKEASTLSAKSIGYFVTVENFYN